MWCKTNASCQEKVRHGGDSVMVWCCCFRTWTMELEVLLSTRKSWRRRFRYQFGVLKALQHNNSTAVLKSCCFCCHQGAQPSRFTLLVISWFRSFCSSNKWNSCIKSRVCVSSGHLSDINGCLASWNQKECEGGWILCVLDKHLPVLSEMHLRDVAPEWKQEFLPQHDRLDLQTVSLQL